MAAKITPQEQARLAAVRPVNPAAHEAYLRGRDHLWKLTPADKEKAREYFEQAIGIDPGLALAYSGMANYYIQLQGATGNTPPQEVMPKAKAAAQKALELDEQLSAAHTSLAWVLMSYDYNWTEAGKEFDRALELNSNDWQAHFWRGFYLGALGRAEESAAEFRRTKNLDPIYPVSFTALAYFWSGMYEKASAEAEQDLRNNPENDWAIGLVGLIRLQQGRYSEALKELARFANSLQVNPSLGRGALGHAYATAGQIDEAQKILDGFLASEKPPAAPIAAIYAALNKKTEAFQWLDRAYAEHGLEYSLKVNPAWKPLRSDPRFSDLLRKIHLTP